jgi:hypothetical protein
VVSITSRQRFAPGKGPPVPIVQEAGWAPEPVWTKATGKILLPLPGIEPRSPGRPVRSQIIFITGTVKSEPNSEDILSAKEFRTDGLAGPSIFVLPKR